MAQFVVIIQSGYAPLSTFARVYELDRIRPKTIFTKSFPQSARRWSKDSIRYRVFDTEALAETACDALMKDSGLNEARENYDLAYEKVRDAAARLKTMAQDIKWGDDV
jgi:hypothetical protein